VIVDAHTHVFPESLIARREELVRRDSFFAALYSSPRARMATARHLLAEMPQSGIARAIIAGVTWSDPATARAHNDALLQAARRSGGRLRALCCIPLDGPENAGAEMERCAGEGAAGCGELRLDHYRAAVGGDALLATIGTTAVRLGLPLLIHASEPVGHSYAGKRGGSLDVIWEFLVAHPDATIILAHMGGGLPLFSFMPEVRERLRRVYVDTAAAPWLYDAAVVGATVSLLSADRVLFGSDYPLRTPGRDIAWLRSAGLPSDQLDRILGGNAGRLFFGCVHG
jgi:uncharacterized protein